MRALHETNKTKKIYKVQKSKNFLWNAKNKMILTALDQTNKSK
jgi:hypothetical protein